MAETKIPAKRLSVHPKCKGSTKNVCAAVNSSPTSVWSKNATLINDKQKHTPIFYIMPEPETKDIDIDGDERPDELTHSDIVEIYAKRYCHAAKRTTNPQDIPDVVIDTYTTGIETREIEDSLNICSNDHKLLRHKKQIFEQIKTDMANSKTTRTMANSTNENENENENEQEYSEETQQLFASLMDYAKRKIPVFVSAGNEPDSISMESFIDGTISVGAVEPVKNHTKMVTELARTQYSSNSDVIAQWEEGTYPVKTIRNANGDVIGYNITDRNNVDVDINKTTQQYNWNYSSHPNRRVNIIEGTSWAAPTAAGKYLRKKFGDACDLPNSKN